MAIGDLQWQFGVENGLPITNHQSLNHPTAQSPNHSITQPIRFFFATPPTGGRRRPAIFLDRDGVINERIINGYVTNWLQFRFIDGAEHALRDLGRLRLPILVVSNQSGVGKGLVTRRALEQITRRFVAAIERRRGRIDGVYYCPHRPDEGCACRKPKPGLLLKAARDWRLDLGASVTVGDTTSDIEAAQAAGCRSIFVIPATPSGHVMSASSGPTPETFDIPTITELPDQVARLLGRM